VINAVGKQQQRRAQCDGHGDEFAGEFVHELQQRRIFIFKCGVERRNDFSLLLAIWILFGFLYAEWGCIEWWLLILSELVRSSILQVIAEK
jgi:hypothetical protein